MSEVSKLFELVRGCVDEEVRSLDRFLPWYNYVATVLSNALMFHRSTLAGSVARATPEVVRNLVIPQLAQQITFVKPYTRLSNKCLDSLKDLIAFCNAVAAKYMTSPFYRVYPRVGVGIVRLAAFLSRSLAEDGVVVDYRTLVSVLNELEVYVNAAIALLGGSRGV
ncbi:MAG: hypothetical protein DRH17_13985 [Deltaproteobacteria bacterium]|nr:MAG: hypothetical protein DRH17_13985 [Deltaproteobacteria bacterium]